MCRQDSRDAGISHRPTLGEIAPHIPVGFECRSCGAAVFNHMTRMHRYLDTGETCCANLRAWVEKAEMARLGDPKPSGQASPEAMPAEASLTPDPVLASAIVSGDGAIVYTDGACKGNPGPAGIGWAVIRDGAPVLEGSRPIGHATNQIAEILAAAEALESLPEGCNVQIRTDSLYVVNTMTLGWKRKANSDSWARLDAAVARHSHVSFVHVRGHRGEQWNEYVDRLASAACRHTG